jgi:DNA-binding LacI/PurR family transcriptional regulator
MTRRPSLSSVATAAGVSPSSVSNAYNKPEHLSAEVRARILAIAAEQGYAGPDPAARSLRSRRAGAIGALFSMRLPYAFSDPYCVELLTGLSETAESYRAGLLLMPLGPHTAAVDDDKVRESVQAVRHAVIDGAVADGIPDEHPALQVLTRRGVPLVRSVDRPDGRCVIVDDRAAGRSLGEHVSQLGHRDVAVVIDAAGLSGDVRHVGAEDAEFAYARLRVAGIREALAPGARLTVVTGGANSIESGRAAARALLEGDAPPTAILAISDALALGVLEVLRNRRLAPGRDLTVTGFDDVPAAAAAGLTTVRQPIREKGRLMGRMLLDSSFAERRVVLPTELVVRASSGLAPTTNR